MDETLKRSQPILSEAGIEKLRHARVAVFGLGGVGGAVVEALVRSGVGAIDLIDGDNVSKSNINRQIIATQDTLGKPKTSVMKDRVLSIRPETKVIERTEYFKTETADTFDFSGYTYVVDAIDDVPSKIALIEKAKKSGVPVISAMGAGNKLDPTAFKVSDISLTSVCPLAKAVRKGLREKNITGVKAVYSTEESASPVFENGKTVPASVSFVPPVMGYILAGEVIKDICFSL